MKISTLTVIVTYEVTLQDIEIPAEISESAFKELNEICIKNRQLWVEELTYSEANDWLRDNIKEEDCTTCRYFIEELVYNTEKLKDQQT